MFKGDDLQNYEEKVQKLSISNGLAWSKNGKSFYIIDSAPRLVYGYDYDAKTGKIGKRKGANMSSRFKYLAIED